MIIPWKKSYFVNMQNSHTRNWTTEFFKYSVRIFDYYEHCACCCAYNSSCIFGIFTLYCGEFSVLDKNQRRSRIFWNASWLLDRGRMSSSMHQDGYMRSYWLGANEHRANLLDSNNEIYEKYYDERSYCSLRTTSKLSELVLLLLAIVAVNMRLSLCRSLVIINEKLMSFKQAVHNCISSSSCWLHRL